MGWSRYLELLVMMKYRMLLLKAQMLQHCTVRIGAHKKISAFLHICKDICPLIQENLLKNFFGFKKVLKKCWEVWGLNLQSLDYSKQIALKYHLKCPVHFSYNFLQINNGFQCNLAQCGRYKQGLNPASGRALGFFWPLKYLKSYLKSYKNSKQFP